MLIGELAQRSGVAARTLRFYEEAEILPPPDRTPGGYRSYEESALERLAFVRSAQAAGLTLAEIRDVIGIRDGGVAPCGHVRALLDAKAEAIDRQLADLRALRAELERLRDRADQVEPGDCDPSTVCEVLHAPAD